MILVTLFISFYCLWLTSYYVIHAYCVLDAVLWVGGVDVYNVDSLLFVCACIMDTHVCVLSCRMPECLVALSAP